MKGLSLNPSLTESVFLNWETVGFEHRHSPRQEDTFGVSATPSIPIRPVDSGSSLDAPQIGQRVGNRTLQHARFLDDRLQPRRAHPGRHPQRVGIRVSCQHEPGEGLRVVLGPHIGRKLGQRPRVGRTLPALRRSDVRWAARLGDAAGDARAIGQHDAVHRLGAQAGQDQGDLGGQAAAQDPRRAQVPLRSVGGGHQDLRRVSASAGSQR